MTDREYITDEETGLTLMREVREDGWTWRVMNRFKLDGSEFVAEPFNVPRGAKHTKLKE